MRSANETECMLDVIRSIYDQRLSDISGFASLAFVYCTYAQLAIVFELNMRTRLKISMKVKMTVQRKMQQPSKWTELRNLKAHVVNNRRKIELSRKVMLNELALLMMTNKQIEQPKMPRLDKNTRKLKLVNIMNKH